ncbi:Methionyl-tRNA formyltransferase [Candidatus Annandia adelgestsuga]|uniref:Methionyl-tRNA formyltransferase n=1 Tax=Candidatus Annandia adelgestsuga TaxID=1302411 RepID=A0A3Q9CLC4_9ENTR|nr:methionyl-tRNA formyltransferase [Candidatus Annandia adelgestsuga]AZP36195.1 Methionyl-tRNA formyltransferase [Candidatus Annandia adelgestsuga]
MLKKLKIIFIGNSIISEKYLKFLLKLKYNIITIITKPDKPLRKNKKKKYSSIKKISDNYNIPILQPKNLLDIYYNILNLKADIIVIISYGNKIPKSFFKITKFGCINIHFSLLPRWRGSSPIQYSILYGDKKTGVTIIKINKNFDEGDIIFQSICLISKNDNSNTLFKKLMYIGIESLILSLKLIFKNRFFLEKQNNLYSTYAYKINKKNAKIKWYLPAIYLKRIIKAFNLWPISFFLTKNKYIKIFSTNTNLVKYNNYSIGEILNISKNGIEINTINGILILKEIQISGKKKNKIKNIINGINNIFNIGEVIN